jgi:insertion element IS1 protein InsB
MRHGYTDGADGSARHLEPAYHTVGKPSTHKIERTHLTFRTWLKRLVRKTIGFSKSVLRHDIVVGLLVNRDAFGRVL